ncbi:MAG: hypothetical protein RLZZ175_2534 [Bacteroidota bacterium]|jgi:hypothetical protein
MKNAPVYLIKPYRQLNTWMFDDESRNIEQEPFVVGIPEMIDTVLALKSIKAKQFSMQFSENEIINSDLVLEIDYEVSDGAWYKIHNNPEVKGWLCPVIHKYFNTVPEKIFIQINLIN